MTAYRQILACFAPGDLAFILPERHIQPPMQLGLYRPMGTGGL